MTTAALTMRPGGLLLPALILAGILGIICIETGVFTAPRLAAVAIPETVVIAGRAYDYRASGDFLRGGATVDGPLVHVAEPAPLEIMKYQVSAADYAQCVTDGACEKAEPRRRIEGNVPATGVSFNDATGYAAWLSKRTGTAWRLPTIEEWAFAAGTRAVDHALGIETDVADPAQRWLLNYQREAALSAEGLATPEPVGSFGVNEHGVADLAAAVWEWTATCASRTTLDAAGNVLTRVESCGVRVLEGRHRTPLSAFIRDAVGGGCSVGVPPDNLGFRLVRDTTWLERTTGAVARWFRRA